MGNYFTSPQDAAYPASQIFGAQRASAPTGTAPSNSGVDFSKGHFTVMFVILLVVGYGAWHYAMTH